MSVDFLDSNVLVYLFDETNDEKRTRATALVEDGLKSGGAVISFQVVQETLNVLTRKIATPLAHEDALQFLDDVLVPLWRVVPTEQLYRRGLGIQDRYRYSFYDGLIIGAALEAGCQRLHSEDLQDGQRIEGLTIVNPFNGEARQTV